MLAYVHMHDMGWGWGILMTLGSLALLGLFLTLVAAAVRDRRLAAREMAATDEYERARGAMSREGPDRSPGGPAATA
jgi:hypothetical protein